MLVESTDKGEIMADYFEKIQWQCPFVDIEPSSSSALEDVFNLIASDFTIEELRKATRKLKNSKASRSDEIPGEYWRCILMSNAGMQDLLRLMKVCWPTKQIPDEWQTAMIMFIFKKDDTSLPSNYRSLALLDIT